MQDFQGDVCLCIDNSFPRGLHQHLADQFLLRQVVDQDGCSICGYGYEMRVKQPKGNCAHQVDMMREIRRCGDKEVLQQEQAESDEPHSPQILELIHKHIENVLRPS